MLFVLQLFLFHFKITYNQTNNMILLCWKSTNVANGGACLGGSARHSHPQIIPCWAPPHPRPGPKAPDNFLPRCAGIFCSLWGHQSGPRTRPWCLRCRHLHEGRTTYTSSSIFWSAAALCCLIEVAAMIHSSTLPVCGRGAQLALVLLPT